MEPGDPAEKTRPCWKCKATGVVSHPDFPGETLECPICEGEKRLGRENW